ncbi:uncharacterized protein M437DRAFT_70567 [Aureobasidium melanogenum CBS 110374]|uniref:Uncharacterized protein n=1 Tax=Aureobasidium melanogenum (strain CBS 110374) TaxID=1043003 RepID=A0A074VAR2_AURM1|nr:uncharacterized protein M437DRAFT_70567 [Aureobasidium melanogenum CBS 110374]KEQ57725.1 hypothetical protein M437DRAFT_70567 [Aureobasidium melanogenum CBS 110374]
MHKMQAHFELWALILAFASLSLAQTFADYAYVSNIEAGSRFQTVSRASLTKQAWTVASESEPPIFFIPSRPALRIRAPKSRPEMDIAGERPSWSSRDKLCRSSAVLSETLSARYIYASTLQTRTTWNKPTSSAGMIRMLQYEVTVSLHPTIQHERSTGG